MRVYPSSPGCVIMLKLRADLVAQKALVARLKGRRGDEK